MKEKSLDEICDDLRKGEKEIQRAIKDMDGWAGRVMNAILAPLENNLSKYPLGHGIPQFGKGGRTLI